MNARRLSRAVLCAMTALLGLVPLASAQQTTANALLDQVAAAMGGRDRLQAITTLVYTGFGQDAYMDGGGNVTAEPNAPPKWRAIADMQRRCERINAEKVSP